jgi:hypothetical protein
MPDLPYHQTRPSRVLFFFASLGTAIGTSLYRGLRPSAPQAVLFRCAVLLRGKAQGAPSSLRLPLRSKVQARPKRRYASGFASLVQGTPSLACPFGGAKFSLRNPCFARSPARPSMVGRSRLAPLTHRTFATILPGAELDGGAKRRRPRSAKGRAPGAGRAKLRLTLGRAARSCAPVRRFAAHPCTRVSAILKGGSESVARPGRGGFTMYKPRIF